MLFRMGVVRGKLWLAALVFPAYWASVEFAVARLSIHGTFFNISYSQMNFLRFCRLLLSRESGASVSRFFCLPPRLLRCSSPLLARQKLPLLIGSVVFIVAVFTFGAWRLASTPNSPTIKVALIASDAPENLNPGTPAEAQQIFQRYADHVKLLAGQGIQLFVLPETIGPVNDTSQAEFDDFFGKLAKETGAYIEIGIARIMPSRLLESGASVFAARRAGGNLQQAPSSASGENRFTPGTKRAVVSGILGKWGLEICKDWISRA